MNPKSPITGGETKYIKTIPSQKLINTYQRNFNIDVSSYFSNLQQIHVYECSQTKYKFFFPFVTGDSSFYEHFQQYEWYYMPWKWEHRQTAKIITDGMKVLEVGCAKGDFLLRMKNEKNCEVVGLEFNESVTSDSISIIKEDVQTHSEKKQNHYDIVCSFQVLEHITEVNDFISGCIKSLKVGGNLVFSVPNRDSFAKNDENDILNMPPHHVGLWNKESLNSLESIFNLSCLDIKFEPLQKYHVEWYINILERKLNNRPRLNKLYHTFRLKLIVKFFVTYFNRFIKGHSIHITFEKK